MEIGRNYISIIITIISNITVLVSRSVLCFGYFIPMNHGFNKKACHPPPLSLTRFVVLPELLYRPIFPLIRLLQKIMHFQSKTVFFFQLITGWFWLCYFVYTCFLGRFSHFFPHETTNSFILCFSSNHVAQQKNSWPWFEN